MNAWHGIAGSLLLAGLVATAAAAGGGHLPLDAVHVLQVPGVDARGLAAEDALRDDRGLPLRFALPNDVAVTPLSHGTWESRPGGGLLWRLRVFSEGAAHLNFGFDRFDLPRSASLTMAAIGESPAIGPLTAADAGIEGGYWSRIVLGEDTLRYDFASRTAVTLRDEPPPRDILPGATDPTLATDSMEFEEISMDAVDVVNDLAEVREVKKQRIESGMHDDSGERTTVAGKDELERLLAEMSVKKGPHFVVRDGDETSLVPLPSEGPVHIGHSDDCVVRLPGWKLFGRLAASMVHQAGGCRRSSRATSAWSSARRCRDRTPTSRCTAVPRSSPARRSRRATPPTSSSHTTAETLPGDPGPVAAGSPHTVTLDRGDVLGVASTFPYLLPSDPDYCADQGWEVGSSGGGAVCTAPRRANRDT